MRLSTKLSGIVAIGGVAALGAGLISSGGIGAAFTDSATAKADLSAGTLNCQLADSTGGVSVDTENARAVSFNLGSIKSSEAGEAFGTVKVQNTGSMGLVASWSILTDGTTNSSQVHPYWVKETTTADQMYVAAGQKSTTTMPIGFQWESLKNTDQGQTFTVTYKVDCFDTQEPPSGITLLGHDGGHATYNGSAVLARLDNGGAAGFFVNDVTTLPSSAPLLTVANESTGANPYWIIRVTNGSDNRYIQGNYANGSWTWNYNTVTYTNTTWSSLVSQVQTDGYAAARAYAQIANSPSSAQSADFTCMTYGGLASFGTC